MEINPKHGRTAIGISLIMIVGAIFLTALSQSVRHYDWSQTPPVPVQKQ